MNQTNAQEFHNKMVCDHSTHIFFVIDAQTLQILNCSDSAVNRSGYSKNEILDILITNIIQPVDLFGLSDHPWLFCNEPLEMFLVKKDLSKLYIEVLTIKKDQIIQISAWDITKRKLIEEKLKKSLLQTQTLLEEKIRIIETEHINEVKCSKLKCNFLANISHEIRTPVNGIIGFSNLLQAPDIEHQKKDLFIQIINNSCNQLLQVIDNLMNMALIESDGIKLNIKKINTTEILSEIYTSYKPKAAARNLLLNIENEVLAQISSDEVKIHQIFSNLLSNAFKFTQSGSVNIGAFKEDDSVIFYIKDTGIGIDQKFHDRIFDKFFQVDNELDRLYEGNGLGLTISKAFVEKMNGKIWVESNLHKGSAFFFKLPLNCEN
ncbi:MAG: HAMP domain-containing histidine kinase [Bacteroidales bacterium]|nr:HAMP domain-containing histidine kinase [Bacteroidales bacterium]